MPFVTTKGIPGKSRGIGLPCERTTVPWSAYTFPMCAESVIMGAGSVSPRAVGCRILTPKPYSSSSILVLYCHTPRRSRQSHSAATPSRTAQTFCLRNTLGEGKTRVRPSAPPTSRPTTLARFVSFLEQKGWYVVGRSCAPSGRNEVHREPDAFVMPVLLMPRV